jgi:hypothetical protein
VGAPGKIEIKLHLQFCRVCFVTCSLSLLTPIEYFWSVHAICSCRSSKFIMFAKGKHGLASVRSWLSHCILQALLLRIRAAKT